MAAGCAAMATCACLGLESAAASVLGGRNELRGQRMAYGLGSSVDLTRRGGPMVVTARTGGGGVPYRPPRISTGSRRGPNQQQDSGKSDGPLMNNEIRFSLSLSLFLSVCCSFMYPFFVSVSKLIQLVAVMVK
jgi:hypothetical protein